MSIGTATPIVRLRCPSISHDPACIAEALSNAPRLMLIDCVAHHPWINLVRKLISLSIDNAAASGYTL